MTKHGDITHILTRNVIIDDVRYIDKDIKIELPIEKIELTFTVKEEND